MPIMLQQNTNTYAGLVNGMRGTVEEVILDTDVQGKYIHLSGACERSSGGRPASMHVSPFFSEPKGKL